MKILFTGEDSNLGLLFTDNNHYTTGEPKIGIRYNIAGFYTFIQAERMFIKEPLIAKTAKHPGAVGRRTIYLENRATKP